MAKPQKSTAQSEVPGLVKKGPLYYLKRDWQLYALMLLPMVFIIVFKYFAYTGLSVAFLDYKIGKGYAGSKFVGLKIFEKVFKHRDFTKAVVNTLLLNVLDGSSAQPRRCFICRTSYPGSLLAPLLTRCLQRSPALSMR